MELQVIRIGYRNRISILLLKGITPKKMKDHKVKYPSYKNTC